jgi:hypothetical protein
LRPRNVCTCVFQPARKHRRIPSFLNHLSMILCPYQNWMAGRSFYPVPPPNLPFKIEEIDISQKAGSGL